MNFQSLKQLSWYRSFLIWLNGKYPVLVAKLRFRLIFGRKLDLKQPKDLNEKILWLSLFSDTSEWSRLADKYAVREYVEQVGGAKYLIPLYGKWNKAEDIDWAALPSKFVMKTNNGCATVLLVEDKSKIKKNVALKLMSDWLKKDTSSATTEFHYQHIKPCILAEEYLNFKEDINVSSSPIDYKIWCFNGKPTYVFVISNRDDEKIDVALFDCEWNVCNEKLLFSNHIRKQNPLVKKPENLKEMVELAAKLARPFPEVRVDLYNINGKIYFGEMTFTSLGGTMDYFTQECLYEMGDMVDLSNIKKIRNI